MELRGKVRDRSVCAPELLENAASGGVRERAERGIEASLRRLNHEVQYRTHVQAQAREGRARTQNDKADDHTTRSLRWPSATNAANANQPHPARQALPCDVFLGAHGNYFGLETKYPAFQQRGLSAFVDPAGYKKYVSDKEQAFRAELAKQKN